MTYSCAGRLCMDFVASLVMISSTNVPLITLMLVIRCSLGSIKLPHCQFRLVYFTKYDTKVWSSFSIGVLSVNINALQTY